MEAKFKHRLASADRLSAMSTNIGSILWTKCVQLRHRQWASTSYQTAATESSVSQARAVFKKLRLRVPRSPQQSMDKRATGRDCKV